MKKILNGLVLFSALIAASCVKKSDTKCSFNDSNAIASAIEIDSLKKVFADSGIVAVQAPSGFFYKISSQGTGTGIANLCTGVTVTYKGSLLNGHVFGSATTGNPATIQLGQVIVGWQKGLPLISETGDITLYIPPSLGYGPNVIQDSQGSVIIPANSYLKFDIHIVDIQ